MTITSGSYAFSVSAVSFSDSPLSTDEPLDLTDITSAERRFAASSKLSRRPGGRLEEEVDDRAAAQRRQLLHLALQRPLEASARSRAAARCRRGSRSAIEIRCRRGGGSDGGSRSSWTSWTLMSLSSGMSRTRSTSSISTQLDLDALAARGGQVLADVVGADRQLAVAAVGDDGELDARRPPVVEEGLDRRRGSSAPCRGRRRRGCTCGPRSRSRAWSRGRAAARAAAPRRRARGGRRGGR